MSIDELPLEAAFWAAQLSENDSRHRRSHLRVVGGGE